jgi:hypothetical protein
MLRLCYRLNLEKEGEEIIYRKLNQENFPHQWHRKKSMVLQANGEEKHGFLTVFGFAQIWFTTTNKVSTFYKVYLLLVYDCFYCRTLDFDDTGC